MHQVGRRRWQCTVYVWEFLQLWARHSRQGDTQLTGDLRTQALWGVTLNPGSQVKDIDVCYLPSITPQFSGLGNVLLLAPVLNTTYQVRVFKSMIGKETTIDIKDWSFNSPFPSPVSRPTKGKPSPTLFLVLTLILPSLHTFSSLVPISLVTAPLQIFPPSNSQSLPPSFTTRTPSTPTSQTLTNSELRLFQVFFSQQFFTFMSSSDGQ